MDFLNGILNYFTGVFTNTGDFWSNITVDGGSLARAIIILLIMMLSAFASYEFMNSIGKNAKIAFWIGLVIPVISAIVFLVMMLQAKHAAVVAAQQAAAEAEARREELAAEKLRIDSTPTMENFAKIKANTDGTYNGPFKLDLVDGTFLTVAKILEVQDTLVAMELVPESEGVTPRLLRMPYSKMTSITKLS